MTAQAKTPAAPAKAIDNSILSSIVTTGDLSHLTPEQKVMYYQQFCERLGLDPISQPFRLLKLNGREILYCDRSGAQQLSKIHNVSHEIKSRETVSGCYVVTAQASTPDGRCTESIGATPIENLRGDALCNAFMKAETKAKRRATLDLLGLGILDETERDTIPEAAGQEGTVPEAKRPEAKPPVAVKQPEAKPPAEKSVFQKQYGTPGEIEKMLAETTAIQQVVDLYYGNQNAIENNAALKALFSARKKKFKKPGHTLDSAIEALDHCSSIEDLTDLRNQLPQSIATDPLFDTAASDKYQELEAHYAGY